MSRIGVFICHCGLNIAGTVDVERAAAVLRAYPGVAQATTYRYMCSDPGQSLIKDAIKNSKLDGVVVASCSPAMHEVTFRRAVADAGLNPYRCEVANIREQCSWVHQGQPEGATLKAVAIIASLVEKVKANQELTPLLLPLVKRALVIGGGIAGLQAALDVAAAGYPVVLVERDATLGGNMARLSGTYLNFAGTRQMLDQVVADVAAQPLITVLTETEVEEVGGYVGNFMVKLRPSPHPPTPSPLPTSGEEKGSAAVDASSPRPKLGEGLRVRASPATTDASRSTSAEAVVDASSPLPELGEGLWVRASPATTDASHSTSAEAVADASSPFPELGEGLGVRASPATTDASHSTSAEAVADASSPRPKLGEGMGVRADPTFGAIIVATGYELLAKQRLGEYGGGQAADVVDGLEFEALLASPTGLRRPSDGKPPREIVFVQCAGSRDPEHGVPYCSKICCMVTAKQAMQFKQRTPGGQAYVFYIDIRSPGKGNDEFVQQAMGEGVLYLRGKVSRVFGEDGKVIVWGADTLSGRSLEIVADLVVLATPMVPARGTADLARRLHIAADGFGFYSEAHPKLRPVESLTAGIYVAGAGQSPKDIPETIAQAGGAGAKTLALFSRDKMVQEPTVAYVISELCAACGQCVGACPFYGARQLHAWQRLATVNEALCQGCGACIVACPNKASQLRNSTPEQVLAMADALL